MKKSVKAPISEIQSSLLKWYRREAREFMWRAEGTKRPDPYVVLLSEYMLQQTQTSRVQQLLPPFLERFPSLQHLGSATNAEVLVAWKGLGYNSRALRLRDCAREIVTRFSARIPSSAEDLRSLPGIGAYTSAAVAVFAFGQDLPILDVNIRRVYSRVCRRMQDTAQTLSAAELDEIAAMIYPKGRASEWHQAVMDLGARICMARRPKCEQCVLISLCQSAGKMAESKPRTRPEPSHRGQPNRIWRGKIVEQLRSAPQHRAKNEAILKNLFGKWIDEDQIWLDSIAKGLCRDGMIEYTSSSMQLKQE